MLIQKISQLFTFNKTNCTKTERRFKILDKNLPYDIYTKLDEAKETIENYAHHNNINIIVSNSKQNTKNHSHNITTEQNNKLIRIEITNEKNKSAIEHLYTFGKNDYIQRIVSSKKIIDIPGEYTQRVANTTSSYQDNFLRYFYSCLTQMTKTLKSKK